jgi:hypothetical protein
MYSWELAVRLGAAAVLALSDHVCRGQRVEGSRLSALRVGVYQRSSTWS